MYDFILFISIYSVISVANSNLISLKRYNMGFSLLEILVAFTITALSLGVILQIYAKGTTSAILGEEYAQAVAIAESKLAAVGRSESLDDTETSGTEDDKYHWTITIQDYQSDSDSDFISPISLKKIHLDLHWQTKGKQRSIQLHTLRPVVES